MQFKKTTLFILLSILTLQVFAQDSLSKKEQKAEEREARKDRINSMIRQEEEGALIYHKQFIFGVQLRNNGYGLLMEWGRMRSRRSSNLYQFELTEYKHPKEQKVQLSDGIFAVGNPYIYGKINSFYQAKLGFGQQYILGQKGNKNGVSVSAIYAGGLCMGLLRPYYVDIYDPNDGSTRSVKYDSADSTAFLNETIVNGPGLGKGWNELKVKPGLYAKTALRFDYGRFNEVVSAIEAGLNVEAYGSKIPMMAHNKERRLFLQAYVMLEFGKRK